MKYGEKKYGESKYGRYREIGNGSIQPIGILSKAWFYFVNAGQGIVALIQGKLAKTLKLVRLVGNGFTSISGKLTKQFYVIISGIVSIKGLISKLINKLVGKGNIKGMGVLSKMHSYFIVTADNILFPLDVKVLGDTREELIAGTRDNVDEVPGKHGEYDFGSELKARFIELKCVTRNGLTFAGKMKLKRKIAEYLNPMNGYRILIFEDDPEVEYKVKYSGKIDIKNYPKFFEFTIPFKMEEPFTSAREESVLVGSGEINNQGSIETGLIIEIAGAVTNPSVTIGGKVLKYTGTIAAGQKLIINTLFQTAKIGTTNALSGYNGVFPLAETGNTAVTAGSNVTIRWKNRYL